jgi:hypothetical protein
MTDYINKLNLTENKNIIKIQNKNVYVGGVCSLDLIIFNKKQEGNKECDADEDILKIKELGIGQFVIVKDYIKDFFFMCDEKCAYYTASIKNIEKLGNGVEKTYEDERGVIYRIK